MLKATKRRSYLAKGTGTPTFVFGVSGTPEEMKAYEDAQAAAGYLRKDNYEFIKDAAGVDTNQKNPYFGETQYFTTRPHEEDEIGLVVTPEGKVREIAAQEDLVAKQIAKNARIEERIEEMEAKAIFERRQKAQLLKRNNPFAAPQGGVPHAEQPKGQNVGAPNIGGGNP